MPIELAANVGYADEPILILDRGHVYFWFADDGKYGLRRVPRTGGAVEPVDGRTVHAGIAYEAQGTKQPRFAFDSPIHIYRFDKGKRTLLGTARGGLGGKHFTFADGYVYWIAPYSTGVGPLHATRLSDGQTKNALPCAAKSAEDCPEIVNGTSVMAQHGETLYRLAGGTAKRVDAKCPVDPQSKLAQEAMRVLEDHVLCEMRQIGWYEVENKSLPEPVLLSLADGKTRSARGLGAHAARAGGHWYHVTQAGIARRANLADSRAGDELVVPLPRHGIMAFTADESGLVWLDEKVWTAPLPK